MTQAKKEKWLKMKKKMMMRLLPKGSLMQNVKSQNTRKIGF
jgi:hypothetical protein